MQNLEKHAFEIRFRPNATIVDKRGSIAESCAGSSLKNWSIKNNRVDFGNENDPSVSAFVSFKEAGFIAETPKDKGFFITECKEFVKRIWNFIPSGNMIRIGIRTIQFQELENFEEENKKLRKAFLAIGDPKTNGFDAELIDVGFPLNFQKGSVQIHTNTGIMKMSQASPFFTDQEALPECGIFIDHDYFEELSKDGSESVYQKQKRVLEFIDAGMENAVSFKNYILALKG